MTGYQPTVSVIILTRNEAENVRDAVSSVLAQSYRRFEVVVVDAASEDATVDIVRALQPAAEGRLRLIAADRVLSVGEARNRGVGESTGDVVAFLSADAQAHPRWLEEMVASLADGEVVYGRQVHRPPEVTGPAVVRGLRYHHFDGPSGDADLYASNVNAGIRRAVFDTLEYPDGRAASALDDILFTKAAKEAGYRVLYNDDMVVSHKDAATYRMEWEKNRREGFAWGMLAAELGVNRLLVAWGLALLAAVAALAAWPGPATVLAAAMVAFAPATRRALRSLHRYTPARLAQGVLLSPIFDITFLLSYAKGWLKQ